MTQSPESAESPAQSLERVKTLVKLVHMRFENGPSNNEWLLDYNLPELHAAIDGLYAVMGEPERLQQAALQAQEQQG